MRHLDGLFYLRQLACLVAFQGVTIFICQSSPSNEIEIPLSAIREQFEQEKTDYQSELNEHGPSYEPLLVRLENLALLSAAANDFESLTKYTSQALNQNSLRFGEASPQAWDATLAQKTADSLRKLGAEQRTQLALAAQNYLQVDQLASGGSIDNAIALVMSSASIRSKILGESHPEVSRSLLDAALLFESQGPNGIPDAIRQRTLKLILDDEPDYLYVAREFASLLYRDGNLADAEQVLRHTQQFLEKRQFEKSEMYATVLSDLGTLAYMSGDYEGAKERLLDAVEAHNAVRTPADSNRATCYQTLALVLLELGEFDAAKQYYEQSLDIDALVFGKETPEYWISSIRFGWLLYKVGEYRESRRLATDAWNNLKHLGQLQPNSEALALTVLGKSAQALRDFEDAERRFRDAYQLATSSPVDRSLVRYQSVLLNNLAKCLQARKRFVDALDLYHQAILRTREELERDAYFQSERQQIASSSSLKYQLDNYVTCLLDAGSDRSDAMVGNTYEQVFGWKGTVLVRQRDNRQFANSDHVKPLFEKLQQAASALSKLSNSMPQEASLLAAWKLELQQAEEHKESLQRELSKIAAESIQKDSSSLSYQEFQRKLPADVIVVDYMAIQKPVRRLVAFVVAQQGPIRLRDLGPLEPIESVIEEWRADIQSRSLRSAAASRLKSYVWSPLQDLLLSQATILVSSDDALGRVPFAALPGRGRDRYLIEDYKIAMLPVPQLLPLLLEHPQSGPTQSRLMTIGDVDYESRANGDKAEPLSEKRTTTYQALGTRRFGPLQETQREIVRIEELFRNAFHPDKEAVRQLAKADASEAFFRLNAPRYTHVHIATHGFFAEGTAKSTDVSPNSDDDFPTVSRRWRGFPTGLQSGLALAGANHPWSARDLDDGILTADEIATLPLDRVELVVLSACETGLGKAAAGEGTLGLQRAFQVSGARSTVSSLWSVSDLGTRILMDRFYENLWNRKLSKIDAFREAQLYMLGKSQRDPSSEQLRAAIVDLPEAVIRSNRSEEASRDFNHPFYWAAFQLSGDWQ